MLEFYKLIAFLGILLTLIYEEYIYIYIFISNELTLIEKSE